MTMIRLVGSALLIWLLSTGSTSAQWTTECKTNGQSTICQEVENVAQLLSITNYVIVVHNGEETYEFPRTLRFGKCGVVWDEKRPVLRCINKKDTWYFVPTRSGFVVLRANNKTYLFNFTQERPE